MVPVMAPPPVPLPGSLALRAVNLGTRLNVLLYRLSGGRLGGRMKGLEVLLLEHVGRRSGRRRTTPLLYLPDGEDLVIVASRGGSDVTPAWWLNLQASPRAAVEIRGRRREVLARPATPEETARLWPSLVDGYPDYAVYQQRTTREIPVIMLTPG
jgi:deazaflavin-dependent oxidoreductase (nitroreductase family)